MKLVIGLDATYSIGSQLTGVGVYCHEILSRLRECTSRADASDWAYPRPPVSSFVPGIDPSKLSTPSSPGRPATRREPLFHGLNQRLPVDERPDCSVTTVSRSIRDVGRVFDSPSSGNDSPSLAKGCRGRIGPDHHRLAVHRDAGA